MRRGLWGCAAPRTAKGVKKLRGARRDPGPPQGLHRRRLRGPVKGPVPLFRRGGQNVRYGIHRRRASHFGIVHAAKEAGVHVFGDVAAGRAQGRRRLPQRGPRQSRSWRQAPRVQRPGSEPARGADGRRLRAAGPGRQAHRTLAQALPAGREFVPLLAVAAHSLRTVQEGVRPARS